MGVAPLPGRVTAARVAVPDGGPPACQKVRKKLDGTKRYFAESKIAELYDEKRAKQKPQPPTPEQEEELRLIAKKAIEASLELADELEAA